MTALALAGALTASMPTQSIHDLGEFQPYVDRLIEIAPSQAECINNSPLIITTGFTHGHGGMYQHDTFTLTVAPDHEDLPLILGHELAHWLDYSCGFGAQVGQDFVDVVLTTSSATIAEDGWCERSIEYSDRPCELFANVFGQMYADRGADYFQDAKTFIASWLQS